MSARIRTMLMRTVSRQRELLRAQADSVWTFYTRYFDERGYFLCLPDRAPRTGGRTGL